MNGMSELPDFSQFCEAACIKIWGEPQLRTPKQLRWSGNDAYGARIFSLQKREWYDHGAQRGGSTLHLVDYHKGRPKRDLRGGVFFEVWREAHAMGLYPDPPPLPKKSDDGLPPILATYPYHG